MQVENALLLALWPSKSHNLPIGDRFRSRWVQPLLVPTSLFLSYYNIYLELCLVVYILPRSALL